MCPSLPLIVTVTVPSAFGSTTNGPPRTVVSTLPLVGFVYVMWKSAACVTSLPLANTVSRSVPSLCTRNGNGQPAGPAGNVNVRSTCVIAVTGWSAAAAGANAARTAAAITSSPANDLILIDPPVSSVLLYGADVLRQLLRRLHH